MQLYIIRHAEPDYKNNTITPQGHLEAEALANKLIDEPFDRIFCSPMGRAIHTMQYTAKLMEIEPVIEPWMAELSKFHVKNASGKSEAAWNIDGEKIRANKPYSTGDNWHHEPPFDKPEFYEIFEELKRNSDLLLNDLGYRREEGRYRIVQPNQEKIAVFCHLGFGLAWIAHLLELPLTLVWSGFFLPPSSVTTVLFDERSSRWAVPRCIGLGDVSHLHKTGLPVSRAGIVANFE